MVAPEPEAASAEAAEPAIRRGLGTPPPSGTGATYTASERGDADDLRSQSALMVAIGYLIAIRGVDLCPKKGVDRDDMRLTV